MPEEKREEEARVCQEETHHEKLAKPEPEL